MRREIHNLFGASVGNFANEVELSRPSSMLTKYLKKRGKVPFEHLLGRHFLSLFTERSQKVAAELFHER